MHAAMVLAAGLGTRLRPLTDEIATPLGPVGDRPALLHTIAQLARSGCGPLVVNTHHRPDDFALALREPGHEAHVSHELVVLGTAGGVRNARALLGEGAVLVWNGDVVAPDLDVAALLRAHAESGAETTWVVAPRARGEGTVGLDAAGAVVRLRGRTFGEEERGGDFLGVHVIGETWREDLPESGCFAGDVALPRLASGRRVATFEFRGEWDDIGTPASLLRANARWLARAGLEAWLGPGARVASGVRLRSAVVGAGATVEGEGERSDAVVLPGARASAPASQAIFGAGCVVRG
jgi:mannose-1-phosphate guanylyltransferase